MALLVGLLFAPGAVVTPAAALVGRRAEAGPEPAAAAAAGGVAATTAAAAEVIPTFAGRTAPVADLDLGLVEAPRGTITARRTVAEAARTARATRTATTTTATTRATTATACAAAGTTSTSRRSATLILCVCHDQNSRPPSRAPSATAFTRPWYW